MKKELMYIIGTSSLSISIIMGMLLPDLPIISFFEGVFVGLSLAMNISFLVKYRIEKNSQDKIEKKLHGV
ncbi:MAG: hypothetical protein ACFFEY_12655 [Candidatus Thorarchaeota archaeon]